MDCRSLIVSCLVMLAFTSVGCDCDPFDDVDIDCAPTDADDDSSPYPTDDDSDDDTDDGVLRGTRSFFLAAAPFQYDMGPFAIHDDFGVAGFAGLIDLLSVHMDFFGIPWDEFADGAPLPGAWTDKMREIRSMAGLVYADVFLSVLPLSGTRNGLAPVARDVLGALVIEDHPIQGCYDFTNGPDAERTRTAYLAYVRWMVDFFEPKFLAHGVETNAYDLFCPAQYDSLRQLLNEVYDQEKAVNPDLPIFPTFILDLFWGYGDAGSCEIGDRTCLQENLAKNADLKRDRFGVSAYPIGMSLEWTAIPEDYFAAIYELSGEQIVFGETGYPNVSTVLPFPTLDDPCLTLFESSDEAQADYLRFLFEQADALGSDLVCWWSLVDFLPPEVLTSCPCAAPGLWCTLYEAIYGTGLMPLWLGWGAMGIKDYDGAEKPIIDLWWDWRVRGVTPSRDF